MNKQIYIAGPMSGLPELNFPAFHAAAVMLREQGYRVINPAEINPDTVMTWEQCMRADIAELVKCDEIYLLPGWSQSRGATLEYFVAQRLGMLIHEPHNCCTAPHRRLYDMSMSTKTP